MSNKCICKKIIVVGVNKKWTLYVDRWYIFLSETWEFYTNDCEYKEVHLYRDLDLLCRSCRSVVLKKQEIKKIQLLLLYSASARDSIKEYLINLMGREVAVVMR